MAAATQLVGRGDFGAGRVTQGSDRDGIERNLFAGPIDPHQRLSGFRRRVFGDDFVGPLVQSDLRAVDPSRAFAVGIEDNGIIDGNLEVPGEEAMEGVLAPKIDGQLSGPDRGERPCNQKRGRRFTRRHEQGDPVGGAVIGRCSRTQCLSQTSRSFGSHQAIPADEPQADRAEQQHIANKEAKATHVHSVETAPMTGQASLPSDQQEGLG